MEKENPPDLLRRVGYYDDQFLHTINTSPEHKNENDDDATDLNSWVLISGTNIESFWENEPG